jgi:hypothetical protein
MRSDSVIVLRSDRPLILAVLFLAAGLGVIFGYGNGTAGFNAAYPVSAASVALSITTIGPAAIGGLALTAIGLVLLIWSFLASIVGQVRLIGPGVREREIVREVPVVREVPEHTKGWVPKS